MKYRAVLFDLDGTLLNTLDDLGDSMNAALSLSGFPPHPIAAYKYFVGDGVENLARRALPVPAVQEEVIVRKVVADMRGEYSRRWKDKTRPYEGIPELLDALQSRGVKLSVLSNKPHSATLDLIKHFFVKWHFDAAMGERPGIPIKPDAGAALEVSRIVGIPPQSFLYLGDTNTDMLTARAAGMLPVGALWGFRTASELRESGAAELAAHPMDVLKLL
jgi:phosphoglycolate phosphatase